MSESIKTFPARKLEKVQHLCKEVLAILAELPPVVGVYQHERIEGERRQTDGTTDNLVTPGVWDAWESLGVKWRALKDELRYFVSRGMEISLPDLPKPFAVGALTYACADRLSPDPTIEKQKQFQEDFEKFSRGLRALARRIEDQIDLGSFQPTTDAVLASVRVPLTRLKRLDTRCKCGEELEFEYDTVCGRYRTQSHPCHYTFRNFRSDTFDAEDLLDEIRHDVSCLTGSARLPVEADRGTSVFAVTFI